MRVVMLSTDVGILQATTSVASRMRAFGEYFDSLTIIVAGRGPQEKRVLGKTLVLYPGGRTKVENFFRMLYYTRLIDAHCVTAQDPLWTGLIALWSGKGHVQIQVHTDTFSGPRQLLARYVLRRARCVRVVSERVRKKVATWTRASLSVLPVYVDVSHFVTPQLAPRAYTGVIRKKVLVVSRLAPEKRVDLAISTIALAEDLELFIAGDGALKQRLTDLAARLGITDRVHFIGWQDNITPYYQHADVVLVPSQFEGYGMVFIEALLAGCPVVSCNVGIVADLPPNAVTIVRDSQYELANALRLSCTPDKKREASVAGRALAQRLPDLEAYCRAYKHVLESCGT